MQKLYGMFCRNDAEHIHADYLITRKVKDFKKSKVITLSPTEFLARL